MFYFKTFYKLGLILTPVCLVAFIVWCNSNPATLTDFDDFYSVFEDSRGESFSQQRLNINEDHKSLKCRTFPDVLIIGFEKCGTITVRQFLGIHPKIFITDSRRNNDFFNADNNKTVAEFTESLPCTPKGQLRLEKLAVPGEPTLVHDFIPEVKLIAVVKDPTERSLSHYIHLIDRKLVPVNVSEFDQFVREIFTQNISNFNRTIDGDNVTFSLSVLKHFSLFADRIQPWFSLFGLDRILILDGDKFATNPVAELRKVEAFLGLGHRIHGKDFYFNKDKRFYCLKSDINSGCMLKGKGRPHPVMKNSTRKILQDFFRPHNEMFYKLSKRWFPWNH